MYYITSIMESLHRRRMLIKISFTVLEAFYNEALVAPTDLN